MNYSVKNNAEKRRLSYIDVTQTAAELSPELIPDEYDLSSEKTGAVYIFSSETLGCNFNEIVVNIESVINQFKVWKPNVSTGVFHDESSLIDLVMNIYNVENQEKTNYVFAIFLSEMKTNFLIVGDYKINTNTIWQIFFKNKSTHLKDVPKVFMFNGVVQQSGIEADGSKAPSVAYTQPPEADILACFKICKSMKELNLYIENFLSNLEHYYTYEDIISVLTHTELQTAPMLISTLTKKMYFTHDSHHGIHYEIERYNKKINKIINDIKGTAKNNKQCTNCQHPLGRERNDSEVDSAKVVCRTPSRKLSTASVVSATCGNARKKSTSKPPWKP